MYRIKERYTNEYIIQKSRFVCISIPLSDESLVKLTIKELQKEYPKATHYCYAYRINNKEKSSDDGEPSGTAGRPMLEYLINAKLENVLVVVIRYFGGIKLGAGGLLRAYVESAKKAFENAVLYKMEYHNEYEITMKYKYYDFIYNYLMKEAGKIINTRFEEDVIVNYLALDLSLDDINKITNGDVKVEIKDKHLVYIKN